LKEEGAPSWASGYVLLLLPWALLRGFSGYRSDPHAGNRKDKTTKEVVMAAERHHIIDGLLAPISRNGLIYTRKCGWVDLGHARPDGARALYRKIRAANITQSREFYHDQGMYGIGLRAYYGHRYRLNRPLTPAQVKSVALGVYMAISRDFEWMQLVIPWPSIRDSGFSAEDLISNLIGFYRAVEPGRNYIALCEPVSKREALNVWDASGPVSAHKNRSFAPHFFSSTPNTLVGRLRGPLPWFLNTIRPAAPSASPGALYTIINARPGIERQR
jgi:hypothetical protein